MGLGTRLGRASVRVGIKVRVRVGIKVKGRVLSRLGQGQGLGL